MSEEPVPITSPARRVVKAKAPPPASINVPKSTTLPPGGDVLEEDSSGMVGYPLASPSLEREFEMERSEKWRKERLDAAAAKHKLQRDKDLQGRRRQNGTVQTTSVERTRTEKAEIPKAFSVEPQFPEHKRSGDVVSEPIGKRRKASIDEGPDDEDRTRRATNVMYVTAALAAAVAIGVAVFRRFGRG